jgi:hypothetical protein
LEATEAPSFGNKSQYPYGYQNQLYGRSFHPLLEKVYKKERKSGPGRKMINSPILFKLLILQ